MTRPHLPYNTEQLEAIRFYAYMKGDGFFEEYEKELARLKMTVGLNEDGLESKAYEATEKLFHLAVPEKERRFIDKEGFKVSLSRYLNGYKAKPARRLARAYQ